MDEPREKSKLVQLESGHGGSTSSTMSIVWRLQRCFEVGEMMADCELEDETATFFLNPRVKFRGRSTQTVMRW